MACCQLAWAAISSCFSNNKCTGRTHLLQAQNITRNATKHYPQRHKTLPAKPQTSYVHGDDQQHMAVKHDLTGQSNMMTVEHDLT
jgi:hypothetical protein